MKNTGQLTDTQPDHEAEALAREVTGGCEHAELTHPETGVKLRMFACPYCIAAFLRAAVEEEREACAALMEGGENRPGSFTNGAGFCRLVDHAQDMCSCAERAAAIRARGQSRRDRDDEPAKKAEE